MASESRMNAFATSNSGGVRSHELEKLLHSYGEATTASVDNESYDAEVMIDELLASTWEPIYQRKGSAQAVGGGMVTGPNKTVSFRQQTNAMNELQVALADSIERLIKHRQVITNRITALEKENQKASSKYQESLRRPEQLLNQMCAQMEDLEERFTKVSSTAVVIGDRLTVLDQERTRVLETDEMMEALVALNDPANKGLTKSSSEVFNILHDPAQLCEAARVIKKMCVFSSELSSPVISYAVGEIERLSQSIENNLLNEFSDAQDKQDYNNMCKYAESLIEYNDKEKVGDRYVWNVMKDRLANNISAHRESSLDPIQDLESLFKTIRDICKKQFVVIGNVFPLSTCNSIRELLVERLFNDPAFGIFSYLDQFLKIQPLHQPQQDPLMRRASDSSGGMISTAISANSEYVCLLCAAYEKTCDLAQTIQSLEVPAPTIKSSTGDKSTNASMNNEADHERMQTFLSLQLHSLFGSHRQRYFRTELDLLQQQFKDVFTEIKFPQQLTAKQKAAATKSKNVGVAAAANSTASTVSLPAGGGASATNISSSNFEKDNIFSTPEMSLIYYETLLLIAQDESIPDKYLHALKESIARCETILKDSELRGELITKMFSSLCASYGDGYLGKISTMTNELLQEPLLTTESAGQYFNVLEQLLIRLDFLEEQYDSTISSALADSPTQLTICYESKRKCLEKLERSIASGLQLVLAVVEKKIGYILATIQDKNDFIGSEANMSLSCSKACKKCTEYLQPLVTMICQVLMEENRDRFLIALCGIFKDLYLQHLQKYRFDPDGACMLLRDVNAYRQIFRTFHHVAVDEIFDILHEVANIFALPPENLGGFIRDGKLATMSKQSLLDIVKRRWDYKAQADKISLS